jgi:hypothetical protein
MVVGADDLGAWLVAVLADAGRKKLTALVLGDELDRALRQAAAAAVRAAARELCPGDEERAGRAAMVVGEVFAAASPVLDWRGRRRCWKGCRPESPGSWRSWMTQS